ncbi:Tryptophan--tRNA ligase [bioreactor metagenome]|uniref:tryptophan--tRNA ligase n=1 Tax=bioreactor metagenome TaxID=1076179 RepID=A0A644T5Q2_9ZZZZ|nr:tryptophan--tRNA ligase [Candidatus Elulimicrobiales bacterium]
MKSKKVLVSGVQTSGELHLGNYFGAIKQMVELVNSGNYEAYIFLADYHSMTTLLDKKERNQKILETAAAYLACGFDKKKVVIFKQSDVPLVTELTWILNTVTPLPMLFLSHAFKDKERDKENEKKDVNIGLLDYPVLMASDILLYNADIVPIGKDQEQHLEMTREIAGKYNRAYNVNTFKFPKGYSVKELEVVPGIDGKKMSKSKGNAIAMFASDDEIKKKVMSIKTDSKAPNEKKNPDEVLIYKIHKIFLNKKEDEKLREKFLNSDKNPYSYKEAKEDLLNTILSYFSEMKKKYHYYLNTPKGKKEMLSVLKSGAKKAHKKGEIMMRKVKKETGLDF